MTILNPIFPYCVERLKGVYFYCHKSQLEALDDVITKLTEIRPSLERVVKEDQLSILISRRKGLERFTKNPSLDSEIEGLEQQIKNLKEELNND